MKLSLESQGASRCDVLVKSLLPGNRVWFSAPIVVKLVQIQQRFIFREATHQDLPYLLLSVERLTLRTAQGTSQSRVYCFTHTVPSV